MHEKEEGDDVHRLKDISDSAWDEFLLSATEAGETGTSRGIVVYAISNSGAHREVESVIVYYPEELTAAAARDMMGSLIDETERDSVIRVLTLTAPVSVRSGNAILEWAGTIHAEDIDSTTAFAQYEPRSCPPSSLPRGGTEHIVRTQS